MSIPAQPVTQRAQKAQQRIGFPFILQRMYDLASTGCRAANSGQQIVATDANIEHKPGNQL